MKRNILTILTLATIALVAAGQNKPFITRILDFMPAPGQFVNDLPEWDEGDTRDDVLERVAELICGHEEERGGTTRTVVADGMVSLGGFGGYVVFGFDHPVVNVPGQRDLQIFGNAFQAEQTTTSGGSCEPGIVMVSVDENGNGLPDDPWYELVGSEHNNPLTQHGYTITYYRPDPDKTAVRDPAYAFVTDAEYIRWTANDELNPDSVAGYMPKIAFHTQSYWPGWITEDQLSFTGTKLPCNAIDESGGRGTYFVQRFYDWGYVDNRADFDYTEPYDESLHAGLNAGFDLSQAIDADGNPVQLRYVDFVKVYSALNQWCGWVGETSTEVAGAIDLHPDAPMPEPEPDPEPVPGDVNGDAQVNANDIATIVNIIAGLEPATPQADVNGDAQVNANDIAAVVNIVAGTAAEEY